MPRRFDTPGVEQHRTSLPALSRRDLLDAQPIRTCLLQQRFLVGGSLLKLGAQAPRSTIYMCV